VKLASRLVDVTDFWEWDRLARENRWTDGLPVAPPTEDRVSQIIEYLGRDPGEVVGHIPPANGVGSIEQIAIQCAMAGCVAEHVPVVLAALDAMLAPSFNLHGVQCTTNPCAPLTIVSGPIAADLGFNVRNGAFGGGGFPNAAIGRAVRLVLWNLGQGQPALNDMSPLGQPAKFSFCVAENLEQSPWRGIHTDFGFEDHDNAVTVFACQSPYAALATGNARRILDTLCEGLASTTINMYHAAGQILVVLAIKPAVELAASGYTKQMVREYFFERARLSVRHLKEWGAFQGPLDSTSTYWGEAGLAAVRPDPLALADDTRLPMVRSVEDIHVIVTGGDTQWWAGFCPGWGNYGGFAVTRPIRLPTG
jgi:hypothetical protein